jgi:hypothetical protein
MYLVLLDLSVNAFFVENMFRNNNCPIPSYEHAKKLKQKLKKIATFTPL